MLFLRLKSINVLFNGSLILQHIKYIRKSKSFVFTKKNLFFKVEKKMSSFNTNILVKQHFLVYKKQYLK